MWDPVGNWAIGTRWRYGSITNRATGQMRSAIYQKLNYTNENGSGQLAQFVPAIERWREWPSSIFIVFAIIADMAGLRGISNKWPSFDCFLLILIRWSLALIGRRALSIEFTKQTLAALVAVAWCHCPDQHLSVWGRLDGS